MNRLLSALALAGAFLLVPTMRAQSTTITASNIADVGAPVTGTWCVQPTQQFVRAGGGNVVPNQVCYAVTAGVLQSGVSLPDSSLTNPVNICYRVTILNTYQERVAQYPCFQPSGSTYSFDNFVQASPPYIPTSFTLPQFLTNGVPNTIQNRINFAGSGVSYSNGTLTFTGGGGGSMTWPAAAGISVYAGGSLWGTSLSAPAGPLVGTTDTQTLTNKTLDGVTPATMGYVDPTSSIQTQLNGKQASLGYTPLNAANNLSDVAVAATARTNLGLGTAAVAAGPTGAIIGTTDTQTLTNKTLDGVTPTTMGYVDPTSSIQTQLNAKQTSLGYTPLNAANNLSDVAVAATARTNLGLGTAAVATGPTGAIVGTTDTQTLTNKTLDGVTPTTMGYVDPTSSIQTQLNGKQASLGYTAAHAGANIDITSIAGLTTALPANQGGTGVLTGTGYEYGNGTAAHTFSTTIPYTNISGTPTPFITSITTTGSSGAATVLSGVLNIPQYAGGGSMTWPAAAGIMVYAGGSAYGTSLTAPTGPIVGTTDTQTLTNKTLDGVTPTTMGFVDPTSSIQTQLNGKQASLGYTPLNAANNLSDVAVAATARTNLGLGTAATAAGPTGTIVGTTDTQTLTNKTLDGVTPTTMGYVDPTSSIQTQINGKQASLGYTPLNAANNLSDVAVAATARTNLGLGSAATAAGPTGTIVGTTDTQTLTNKTLDGVTPATMGYVDPTSSIQTQLNGKQASLGYTPLNAANNLSDVAVAATARTNLGLGTAAIAAGPTGAIIGTTDTQTLTNKTLDGVTPATMGYVDPTSSIQTQLNGKQASLGYTAAHAGANGDITSLTGITTALTVAQGGTGVGAGTGYEYGNGTAAHTFSTTIPYSAISSPPTLAATLAKVSHQWLDSYTASTGLFTQSQLAFSDLSGSATAAQIPAALSSTTSVNGTTIPATVTLTQTIASGTAAMGTAAIASNACASVVTVTATGTATTDNIVADFNADPTATTGYIPGAMLTIVKYPTSGSVNFKVCNNTGSSITPSAVTLNWRVTR